MTERSEFTGVVESITEDTVRLVVEGEEMAFIPLAVIPAGELPSLKLGVRIEVRIIRRAPDDTGEWELRILR